MPRNEITKLNAGPITADNVRIQPGRVMIVLKDPLITEDMVYKIAAQYGSIRNIHRPSSNPTFMFVQYEDADGALRAIEKLKNYPIFVGVDPALKSERFCNDNSNSNQNQNSKNSAPKMRQNKGGNQQMNNMNGGFPNNNNNSMNSGDNANRSYNSMDSDSPHKAAVEFYQPEFPLGCWFCTKMPSFECQCGGFYCDANCQRMDWPKHKLVCMPRLVPISYSNKRILQEAAAAKQSTSSAGPSYSLSSNDQTNNAPQNAGFQHQRQNQQQRRDQQQPIQQQPNQQQRRDQQQPNQKQRRDQQQPNQQQNRGLNMPKKNQGNNQSDQNQFKQQQQQQQQQQENGPEYNSKNKQSSDDDTSSKVGHLGNKLQRLKLAKSSKVRILEPGQFPREGSRVKITTILPSGVVYIYHNNSKPGQQSDYQQLANKIFNAASEAKPLREAPKVDDIIFAPYQDGFYRGKVLEVKGDKVEIQYPDFGNMETVAWKQAKEIADEDIKWAKYLAYPVILEGVGTLTSEMKLSLESFEGTDEFELVNVGPVENSVMKEVVLKRPKQALTLNMELMELKEKEHRLKVQREEQKEHRLKVQREEQKERERREKEQAATKIPDPSNYKPVLFDDSMETRTLAGEKKHDLLIIDASEVLETDIISVIASKDAKEYALVVQDCESLGPADPNIYRPCNEGEVCLVRYQQDWSRALFDQTDGNFLLLDVGILASVDPADVRRFPPGLSRVVYNNEVIVENLPTLKEMMTNGKPESVHGKQIEAWVTATEDGVNLRIYPAK